MRQLFQIENASNLMENMMEYGPLYVTDVLCGTSLSSLECSYMY